MFHKFEKLLRKLQVIISVQLEINQVLYDDGASVVGLLNEYFINTAQRLSTNIREVNYVADAKLHNFINSRIDLDTYFNIPFITFETVINYMNALSDKKATGFDNVSAKLIRSFAPDLIQPMTEIINASIKACIFPDPWKVARVVPLFKGG